MESLILIYTKFVVVLYVIVLLSGCTSHNRDEILKCDASCTKCEDFKVTCSGERNTTTVEIINE